MTGASRQWIPCAAAIAASRSSSCRSLVLVSIQVPPGASPSRRPASPVTTSATACGEGRQVKTVSDAAATSCGEAAQAAPASSSGRAAASSRSCTVSGKPAREEARRQMPAEIAEPDEAEPHRDDDDLAELGARVRAGRTRRGRRSGSAPSRRAAARRSARGTSRGGGARRACPSMEPRIESWRQKTRARSADGSGPVVAPATTTMPPGLERLERVIPGRLADRLEHGVDPVRKPAPGSNAPAAPSSSALARFSSLRLVT